MVVQEQRAAQAHKILAAQVGTELHLPFLVRPQLMQAVAVEQEAEVQVEQVVAVQARPLQLVTELLELLTQEVVEVVALLTHLVRREQEEQAVQASSS